MLELLAELLFEVVAEILFEFGLASIAHSSRPGRRANPFMAAMGLLLVGGFVGLVFSIVVPIRILGPSPMPGVSLVISPLLVGATMRAFGKWRRRHGGDPTVLATFWGGALFAFAIALTRLLMVGGEN